MNTAPIPGTCRISSMFSTASPLSTHDHGEELPVGVERPDVGSSDVLGTLETPVSCGAKRTVPSAPVRLRIRGAALRGIAHGGDRPRA